MKSPATTAIGITLAVEEHMRLIWKKYDSTFDPLLTVVGIGFTLAGLYGVALLRHAFRHPVVLMVAAIPLLLAVMGVLIVVREVQLFKTR